MATYHTTKLLAATPAQTPQIAEAIRTDFEADGFEVAVDSLMSGGRDISITKGNLFKAVLGMRSALKITLTPQSDGVFFDANVGIFGQQAIPTVITMFLFWPVLLTQIWGLVQQASLDDRALAAAERAIDSTSSPSSLMSTSSTGTAQFCTSCGTKVDGTDAKFCPNCGNKL